MPTAELFVLQTNSLPTADQFWTVAFAALAVVGSICAAIGTVIAFFLTRYWHKRDSEIEAKERALAARDAQRLKQREILYDSLKWFEGGTQNRSIGIAVIKTSWNSFPEFQELWGEVLSNQAIYLLTASGQADKQHEHDNLRRIMELLVQNRSALNPVSKNILLQTIGKKEKNEIEGGLTLTDTLKNQWLPEWRDSLSIEEEKKVR